MFHQEKCGNIFGLSDKPTEIKQNSNYKYGVLTNVYFQKSINLLNTIGIIVSLLEIII